MFTKNEIMECCDDYTLERVDDTVNLLAYIGGKIAYTFERIFVGGQAYYVEK